MALELCACGRHVRKSEACPYCGGASRVVLPPRPPRTRRAAMVGVAAVALACGGTTNPGDAGGNDAAGDVVDMDAIGVFYGAPPLDASPNDASKSDAAPADATTDQDAGGIALYGAPPPLDSGEG